MGSYVAFAVCGCVMGTAIDDPEYREIVAEWEQEMSLKGYRVERMDEAPPMDRCAHASSVAGFDADDLGRLCSYCEASFIDAMRARQEVERVRAELQTSWEHGRTLSEEVDRLRAMIREANRMGLEILEQVNSQGSGAREH